mmetsp:Transcript_44051/g.104230  ORF Transcript_44051/g.104230 Transcript_44051/m.104230 type:complete len:410 (+) Transcript_44051:115-1344(+)
MATVLPGPGFAVPLQFHFQRHEMYRPEGRPQLLRAQTSAVWRGGADAHQQNASGTANLSRPPSSQLPSSAAARHLRRRQTAPAEFWMQPSQGHASSSSSRGIVNKSESDGEAPDNDSQSFWGRGTAEVNNLEGIQKMLWECVDHPNIDQRSVLSMAFPESLCYYDAEQFPGVQGVIALTIDDAPGRFGAERSQVDEVRRILRRYGARATFFVMSDYIQGHERALQALCHDGNELQNHGARDEPYYWESEEDFQHMLLRSQAKLDSFAPPAARWFRAPKGLMSEGMKAVLAGHGYKNVMFDRYALDTEVDDPEWIAEQLLHKIESGSIALIHMPEKDFRAWNLRALDLLLRGLQERGLRAVTLSELSARAVGGKDAPKQEPPSMSRSSAASTESGDRRIATRRQRHMLCC